MAEPWTAPEGSWASSEAIRKTMLGCRNRDTVPEIALRSAVHRAGLRFRVAKPPIRGIRRTADIVFPGPRVAVFLDGCFWHACPDHYVPPQTNAAYWHAKIRGNAQRDRDTDAKLVAEGWEVVRVWEHEPSIEAAARVVREVRKRLPAPGPFAHPGT
jgi:DNA mismatch endonuclease (patch repair protein)